MSNIEDNVALNSSFHYFLYIRKHSLFNCYVTTLASEGVAEFVRDSCC